MNYQQRITTTHHLLLLRLQLVLIVFVVLVTFSSLPSSLLSSSHQVNALISSPQRRWKIQWQNVPFGAMRTLEYPKYCNIHSLSLSSTSSTILRESMNTVQEEEEVKAMVKHQQCKNKKDNENKNSNQATIMSRRKAILTTGSTFTSLLALSSVASNSNAIETKPFPSMGLLSSSTPSSTTTTNVISTVLDELLELPSISTATTSTSVSSSSISATLQETISGFISGATITAAKTFIKYPLDTVTVRMQMKPTPNIKTMNNIVDLFKGSYNGVSTPLLSNIPAGALFFAVKDATKSMLKQQQVQVLPKWLSTCIAVGVALPPYWFLRNPSEVLKTRLQIVGTNSSSSMEEDKVPSAWDAIQTIYKSNHNNTMDTIQELYTGYSENMLYGYPADVIKFVAYEALSSSSSNRNNGNTKNGKVTPLQGALYGAGATAIAQFITTPLDVVRNRVMVADTKPASKSASSNVSEKKISYVNTLAALAKEEGLKGLFAGATPRIGKAILSGAIQFATYEETKETVRKMLDKR